MPQERPVWKTSFGRGFVAKTPSWRALTRKGFTELWATALLVFAACLGAQGPVYYHAAAIGLTAAILIASFGSVSGCHINPAVSVAMFICGMLSGWLEFFIYLVAQTTGGMIGGIFGRTVMNQTLYVEIHGGITVLSTENANIAQGILLEAIITAQLVLTALATSNQKTVAPLYIGISIFLGMLIAGPITGGSMNPMRSFGVSFAYWIFVGGGFEDHYVYWAGPIVGAVIAAILWKLVFADDLHRWPIMERIFGAKDENFQNPDVTLKSARPPAIEADCPTDFGSTLGTLNSNKKERYKHKRPGSVYSNDIYSSIGSNSTMVRREPSVIYGEIPGGTMTRRDPYGNYGDKPSTSTSTRSMMVY